MPLNFDPPCQVDSTHIDMSKVYHVRILEVWYDMRYELMKK
jgi:hypothetical protein